MDDETAYLILKWRLTVSARVGFVVVTGKDFLGEHWEPLDVHASARETIRAAVRHVVDNRYGEG